MKEKTGSIAAGIIKYFVLICISVLVIIPLSWLVIGAFKTEKEILSYPPTFFTHSFTLDNFEKLKSRIDVYRYITNSVIYAVGTTAIAVVVNSMAGYAYARKNFKGKGFFFLFTLSTMMVPFQVVMVPMFLVVYKLGMYNTYWGLIIPRVAVAGSIFMMRAAFEGLPKELEDAARIDGLGEFGIFYRIMLPQVKSAVICLVILSINGSWNDLLWPMLVASDTKMRTLANGLALFVGQNSIQYGASFAGAVVSILPMLIIYLFGQKYFVEGMASSGLKS
ncbi:carbohydrate ABC transporter permease [Butyrivibrio sp. AC2005]|uniref:carbohydrate ABC transporter permease n=1 Tax=Butyrivibrio sp. AC2005 TaxID=1280672 RepID=UPI000426F8D9|nr:carbohydrate ABC transporter permease [Butyrivibrio sp. AC2005]